MLSGPLSPVTHNSHQPITSVSAPSYLHLDHIGAVVPPWNGENVYQPHNQHSGGMTTAEDDKVLDAQRLLSSMAQGAQATKKKPGADVPGKGSWTKEQDEVLDPLQPARD